MELERLMPEFENRVVQVVAVSSDHAEQGKAMADKINAERLPVGYELSLQSAQVGPIHQHVPRSNLDWD
jgi:hypothetical protein